MIASAAALFVLGNAAALLLAALAGAGLCRDRSLPIRWIAVLGCYLLIACLTTLGLGLTGLLKPWSPALALGGAALIAVLVRRRKAADSLRTLVPELDAATCREQLGTLVPPMLALFTGLAAVWIVSYTLLGTFLTFDDKTYHAPSLVQWMQSGTIELTAFSYQSYYAFNAELLALWYMMPFGSDAAVPLAGLVYAALFVLISLELGRRWRLPLWCRLAPALLFLSSIEIVSQCNWFADVDVAAPVVMLAALAIGCRDSCPALRRQVLLAGALAGFAVGMKPTFAPFAGVLLIIVAGRIFLSCRMSDAKLPTPPSIQRLSFFGTLANGLGFFIAASITGGYWYLRNLALTGNPLYPAQLGPFAGPLTPDEQSATTIAHAITNGEFDGANYGAIGEMLFSWPATHAMLAMFAVIVAGAAVFRLRRSSVDATAATAVALTAFALLCVALFPWMPFSARGDDGNFYLEGSSRYLTLAYLCGFLLFPRLLSWIESPELRRHEQWLVFLGVTLLLTMPLGLALDLRFSLAALAVAVITLLSLQILHAGKLPAGDSLLALLGHPLAWLAALAMGLLAAAAASPISLRATDRQHLDKWTNARIEELPAGSRIAMYFDLRPEIYSIYGRRYQHQPLRLSADGSKLLPLHQRRDPKAGRGFFDYAFDRRIDIDPQRFLSNLRTEKIDFVVTPTMPHRKGAWPVQHAWLNALGVPAFCKSDDAVIWDLRSRPKSDHAVAAGDLSKP